MKKLLKRVNKHEEGSVRLSPVLKTEGYIFVKILLSLLFTITLS